MEVKSPMRIAREKRGITQEQLANLVGVTTPQISRIEASGVPIIKTAASIVHHLGNMVSLDEVCRPDKYLVEISEEGISEPGAAA